MPIRLPHPCLRRLLGRKQTAILNRVRLGAEDVITAKPTYIGLRFDFSAGLPSVVVESLITYHLAPCPCCGEPFAARLRHTSRNNMFSPLDDVRNGSTETIWPHETCSPCREDALNRERVARHRAHHRKPKQPITCAHCGQAFERKRSTARFCSGACRVAAHRAGKAEAPPG